MENHLFPIVYVSGYCALRFDKNEYDPDQDQCPYYKESG